MAKYFSISKIDASKRQLETAITLFFNYADPVSLHTLTVASHTILKDLAKKQQIKSILRWEILSNVKPEKKNEIKKIFTEADNFFKHADKDPDKLLKFYYEPTVFLIWDACYLYQKLSNEISPLMVVFRAWFNTEHYDLLLNQDDQDKFRGLYSLIDHNNRIEYIKEFLPLIYARTGKLEK